ncbi:HD domain-containing protein [Edaphobacter paludis]|uniref:HD domain-containing protein n=1 Tax=Edaphobacter paludis TaxID=3035702 RepID=UPI0035A09167
MGTNAQQAIPRGNIFPHCYWPFNHIEGIYPGEVASSAVTVSVFARLLLCELRHRRDSKSRESGSAARVWIATRTVGDGPVSSREEFEARVTPEARFARAIDRLQPLLHNYYTRGLSWKQHGISAVQVRKVMSVIDEASRPLGELAAAIIEDSVDRGFLPETSS